MRDVVVSERLDAVKVSRLDVMAFMAAFLVGVASYFVLRFLLQPDEHRQWWQTVAILVCMGGYAFIVAKVPRLRVRLDQAGDNAYYLGLLFTLGSMAVALYDFGQSIMAGADEAGTASILSNFGVALASTIAGIFLRVILHQIRVDPADVESMTRIELAEAAKRVKGTLDSVTVDMGRFHDEIRQRTDDVVADVLQKVQSLLGDFSTAVGTASSEVIAQIGQTQSDVAEKSTVVIGRMEETANHAAAAIENLRHVEAPPTKLANRLEKVTASLEALGGQVQVLSEHIGGMGASTQEALNKLVEALERLRQLTEDDRRQYGEGLREIGGAVRELKTELGGVGEVLIADASLIRSLEEQARRSAEAVEGSQRAANDVLTALTESTRTLVTVVRQESSSGPG